MEAHRSEAGSLLGRREAQQPAGERVDLVEDHDGLRQIDVRVTRDEVIKRRVPDALLLVHSEWKR